MSGCPDRSRLAAAVSGEDDGARLHADGCARCGAEIDAMSDLVALARRTSVRLPSAGRRAELAAELLARADLADDVRAVRGTWRRPTWDAHEAPTRPTWDAAAPRNRARRFAISAAAAAVVAASVALVVARSRAEPVERPAAPDIVERITSPVREVARVEPPPAAAPPGDPAAAAPTAVASGSPATVTAAAGADYRRTGDTFALASGTLAIDARGHAPATVIVRATRIALSDAHAEITAHAAAIESVRVFAGTAEVSDGGRHIIVAAGDVWTAPRPHDASPRDASARAFRDGWLALHANHDADAVAAFDRATDPAVAEDATYWAAVATERLGDRPGALRRLRDFIARFPASPRIGAARAAIDRLAP